MLRVLYLLCCNLPTDVCVGGLSLMRAKNIDWSMATCRDIHLSVVGTKDFSHAMYDDHDGSVELLFK